MCERADWMDEFERLGFSLYSLVELFPKASCERENVYNIAKGIESRLNWMYAEAKRELKRDWGKHRITK